MAAASSPVVFAAVGDVHGCQHAMVRLLSEWERQRKQRLAFVLQVGDFEPVRDHMDLASTPVPQKYRKMGDFAAYHMGFATFPWPVWFVAGNHEPFAFLASMSRGGQAAHNCFYLGRSGQMDLEGLRLAWLGGVSVGGEPLDEPLGSDWKKHAYFRQREIDEVLKDGQVDILMLHEWPRGAATREEAMGQRRSGGAFGPGNDSSGLLVELLQPRLVLAGHSHWPHRSRMGRRTAFFGLGHIDKGRDAFAVFRREADGEIVEIT